MNGVCSLLCLSRLFFITPCFHCLHDIPLCLPAMRIPRANIYPSPSFLLISITGRRTKRSLYPWSCVFPWHSQTTCFYSQCSLLRRTLPAGSERIWRPMQPPGSLGRGPSHRMRSKWATMVMGEARIHRGRYVFSRYLLCLDARADGLHLWLCLFLIFIALSSNFSVSGWLSVCLTASIYLWTWRWFLFSLARLSIDTLITPGHVCGWLFLRGWLLVAFFGMFTFGASRLRLRMRVDASFFILLVIYRPVLGGVVLRYTAADEGGRHSTARARARHGKRPVWFPAVLRAEHVDNVRLRYHWRWFGGRRVV